MKYNIAFYCQSIPFTAETCQLKTSLGGSETALICIARELAKLGHHVVIFTQFDENHFDEQGEYDGVRFWDISAFKDMMASVKWNIFISLRMNRVMIAPIKADARFLWCQDELTYPDQFMATLWQTDKVFFVSEWQKEHYCKNLDTIRDYSYVTRNGIDLDFIKQSIKDIEKDPYKLIYISRPERGLDPLLQIFPKIKRHCPEAELKVCRYYSMYEPNPNIKAICDKADKQIAQIDGVEYLGNLSKDELYKEIASSKLMVYPGVPNFNETSCIAALEAQACGTPLICSNRGGLQETANDKATIKLDGDAFSQGYQERFTQEVLTLLVDDGKYQEMQEAGYEWVKQYDYSVIAQEWESHFNNFFENRYKDSYKKIYDNLQQYEDKIAASWLANDIGDCNLIQDAKEQMSIVGSEDEEKKEYAIGAIPPQIDTGAGRFHEIINTIMATSRPEDAKKTLKILDFACGNGSLSGMIAKAFENISVTGIDYSPDLIQIAQKFVSNVPDISHKVNFLSGSFDDIPEEKYDIVICGEYLEHDPDYLKVIENLESHLIDDGLIVFTVPYGPLKELRREEVAIRGHVNCWQWFDIYDVFSDKKDFHLNALQMKKTVRGNPIGHWIIDYRKSDIKAGNINWERKVKTTRPFQKLSVCMIGRNDAKWVDLCMEQIYRIADEIIVATNGDDPDGTIPKLKEWGAKIIQLPLLAPDCPEGTPPPGNFAWLRNESIKHATGDWIMWLDLDERLTYPERLRKYLASKMFKGFGLRQIHLTVDQPGKNFDMPIRIFKNGLGIKCYGAIHEHFEQALDEPIFPSLEISESELAHYGYLTEYDRRYKCLKRNYAMLQLDRQFFPERIMTDVLQVRDHMNFALWEFADNNQQMTVQAQEHLYAIINMYRNGEWYNKPAERYFKLIFKFYQKALNLLKAGLEFKMQSEDGQSLRFLSPEEFREYSKAMIDEKTDELLKQYPTFPKFNKKTNPRVPNAIGDIPLPDRGRIIKGDSICHNQ